MRHHRRHLVEALQREIALDPVSPVAIALDDLVVAEDAAPVESVVPAPPRRTFRPITWVRSLIRSIMRSLRHDTPPAAGGLHEQLARHGVRLDAAADDRQAALALLAALGWTESEIDLSRSDDYVISAAATAGRLTPVRVDSVTTATAPAAAPTGVRSDEPRTDTAKRARRARKKMIDRQDRAWERPIGTLSPAAQAQLAYDALHKDDDDGDE